MIGEVITLLVKIAVGVSLVGQLGIGARVLGTVVAWIANGVFLYLALMRTWGGFGAAMCGYRSCGPW